MTGFSKTFLFSVLWDSFSPWWLLACLAAGFLYAWLFYRRQESLNIRTRYFLGVFRFLAVTIISLLLLSPVIKTVTRHPQKPLVLVAQDNSASIPLFEPKGFDVKGWMEQLGELKKALGSDYDVGEFHFDKELKDRLSAAFDGKQTDISAAIKGLSDRFANQNIGAVVLATDGIYNSGSAPQYVTHDLKAPIYTIALGDTVPKPDLVLGNINYNKTAFLGNDFEVEVLVEAYQNNGTNIHLNISEDGKPIASKDVPVTSADFHQVVTVKLHADRKGVHKFTFDLQQVANEISTVNNSESVYVEVLDNKRKILLLYNGPHPDIAAIEEALKYSNNFELKVAAVSNADTIKMGMYSLVILYQLPASGSPMPKNLQSQLEKLKIPVWYILGAQSDVSQFNRSQNLISINATRQDMQEVFASMKADFTAFTLADSTQQRLSKLPPLLAPFGEYKIQSSPSVLLAQKIGNITTAYPLLVFGEDGGTRTAVLSGEGIWKWRLAEYAADGSTSAVDELLNQSVQYLTSKSDRTRFKVYPAKDVFYESEDVSLNGELFNDAFELTNTPDVKVEIKGKSGKTYSYILARQGQRYQLDAGMLPPDEYTFHAETKLGNQTLTSDGQFVVKYFDMEMRQSIADHKLLYAISKESGGQMILPSQTNQLAGLIKKNGDIKTVVYADETYHDLIDEKWVFLLVVVLLAIEWFLRKREGEL